MGGDCSPSLAPCAWCQETGFREPAHPPTASPLPPMASTHSHPHPSHRPPHPSQAWLRGEHSSPSPGTMVRPRARVLRSGAQRSCVCFWPVISHPRLPAGTRLPGPGMGLVLVSSLPRGLCAPGPLVWAVFWLSHRASPAHPLAQSAGRRELGWPVDCIVSSMFTSPLPLFPVQQGGPPRSVGRSVGLEGEGCPGQAGLPWC